MDNTKLPKTGDIVICEVLNVNPNSIYVKIEEYNLNGMIHVSELSTSWVKDIRKFAKKGQKMVLKVLPQRDNSRIMNLSLKRVKPSQKREKLDEVKNEKKALNILKFIIKKLDIQKDSEDYKKIHQALIQVYGTLNNAFNTISLESTDSNLDKYLTKEWIQTIEEISKEKIKPKKLTIKGTLTIKITCKDGISLIKKALDINNPNLKIRYISAPKYMIEFEGDNYAIMEKNLSTIIDNISEFIKSNKGTSNFAKV